MHMTGFKLSSRKLIGKLGVQFTAPESFRGSAIFSFVGRDQGYSTAELNDDQFFISFNNLKFGVHLKYR